MRTVKLGARGEGFIKGRDGMQAGAAVVVTASFLLDAESNLNAKLQGFTADAPVQPRLGFRQ